MTGILILFIKYGVNINRSAKNKILQFNNNAYFAIKINNPN